MISLLFIAKLLPIALPPIVKAAITDEIISDGIIASTPNSITNIAAIAAPPDPLIIPQISPTIYIIFFSVFPFFIKKSKF